MALLRRAPRSAEGSDARVIRNTALSTGGMLIAVAIGLVLTPILIHRLGNAGYGVWALATTLTFGAGYLAFADLGFEDAAGRYIAEARADRDWQRMNELFSTTFAMLLAVTLIVAPPLVLLAKPLTGLFAIPPALKGPAVVAFQFVLAQLLFDLPGRAFSAVIEGSQRGGLLQIVRFSQTVLLSALMAAVALSGGGIDWLARSTFAASALIFVIAAVIALLGVREARLSPTLVTKRAFKRLANFSGQLFAFRVMSSIYRQIDKTVIGILLTASLVTTYEIGNRLYMSAALVQTLATGALVPATAFNRKNLPRLQDMLLRGTSYVLAVALPCTLAAIVFASPLIRTWIGPGHGDSTLPAQLLLATLIPSFTIAVGQSMLTAIGRIMSMLWLVTAWTVLNVALTFALARPLGVNGVVVATLVATVAFVVPLTRLFLREFEVSARRWLTGTLLPQLPGVTVQAIVGLALLPLANRTGSLALVAALGGVSIVGSLSAFYALGLRGDERGYLLTTLRRAAGREPSARADAAPPAPPVPLGNEAAPR